MRAEAKAAIVCVVGALAWFLPWLLPGRALLGTHPALYRPYEECVSAKDLAEIKAAAHPLYGDKLVQHDPEVRFSGDGEALPSWNPWVLGGLPHVAQGLASPLYPLMWLERLIAAPRCYAWIAALQTALQAWFAFLMLRAFGVRAAACGVFALLFAGSGWMSVHQEYFQLTAAATWLPLSIGGAKRLLDQRGGLFSLALAIGCAFLSGFPQIAFYVALAPALLWVATVGTRLIRRSESAGSESVADAARHAGRFLVAAVLGLALASPQLLATAEFIPHSTRKPYTPEQVVERALPPAALIGALFPDLFTPAYTQADLEAERARAVDEKRLPWLDTLFARTWLHSLRPEQIINRFEITFALGPAALILALLGMAKGRRGARGFLIVLLSAGLVLSLRSPLLQALAHLPGFNVGDPKRALLLVAVAIAGLAALGVEALVEHATTRRAAGVLLGGAIVVLMAGAGATSLLPEASLREIAAPVLAEDLRSSGAGDITAATVATALSDSFLADQRWLLRRELLIAALFLGVGALAIAWFAQQVENGLRLAALLGALALPLAWLWLDATRPIPTAALDARPSVVAHFDHHPARGRLVRLGLRSDSPEEWAWPPKLPMNSGVRDAQGYVAAYLARWRDLFEALEPGSTHEVVVLPFTDPATLTRPLVDLLDIEYLLAALPKGALPPAIAGFDLEPLDPPQPATATYQLTLWKNREPFGRARIVESVRIAEDDAALLRELVKPEFEPTRVAWMTEADAEKLPAELAALSELTPRNGDPPTVASLHETPTDLHFRVTGRGGLLVQTDCWYPGWIAKVDGEEVPLLRVDHALRGVTVPAGDHDVQLLYVPRRLLLGMGLMPIAAGLLLFATFMLGRARLTS